MDYSFAREFAETFRASTPIHGSSATFSQTPCFLPSLALRAVRKACSSLKTSRTSGRITTQHSSPGRKTSVAPGPALPIATANVSGGCGDFIFSVAREHFARAVCRSFRFSFQRRRHGWTDVCDQRQTACWSPTAPCDQERRSAQGSRHPVSDKAV